MFSCWGTKRLKAQVVLTGASVSVPPGSDLCHRNVVNLICPCWDTTTALRGLCLETSLQFMVAQPETWVPECRAPACTSWHDVVAAEFPSRREIQKS